ncbi:MAG: copper resistance protein CopC [bacterium]|nr:copper resistance protein CopC [bacterium]
MKAILLAGLLALAAIPALAHSALDATAPENGAVLAQVPPHVVLTFANRIRLTRVHMTHDAGDAIDLDLGTQTSFATRFELPLKDLGSGLYRIEWRGLSGDGHVMRAVFTFRVQ